MRHTRFWRIFSVMKSRCSNKNVPCYKHYGGRGVKVLWESFEEFRNDMYESYKIHVDKFGEKNTMIDRINNNGNYCKENCKWATYQEQQNNKRSNNFICHNGETKTISEWSKITGIPYGALHNRIKRKTKNALTKSFGERKDNIFVEINGKKITLKEYAKEIGVQYTTLWRRIRVLGWSIERAITEKVR